MGWHSAQRLECLDLRVAPLRIAPSCWCNGLLGDGSSRWVPCHPHRRPWLELWAPGFSLAQACCSYLLSEPGNEKSVPVLVCFCVFAFQTSKSKWNTFPMKSIIEIKVTGDRYLLAEFSGKSEVYKYPMEWNWYYTCIWFPHAAVAPQSSISFHYRPPQCRLVGGFKPLPGTSWYHEYVNLRPCFRREQWWGCGQCFPSAERGHFRKNEFRGRLLVQWLRHFLRGPRSKSECLCLSSSYASVFLCLSVT